MQLFLSTASKGFKSQNIPKLCGGTFSVPKCGVFPEAPCEDLTVLMRLAI
jgi:hypothetical protein